MRAEAEWSAQATGSLNVTIQQLEIVKAVLAQDGWTQNEITVLLLALVVEAMDS